MIFLPGTFSTAITAAIASFIVSILIVITQGWHGKHSLDEDVNGVQKFHQKPVPRIGGIALVSGLFISIVFSAFEDSSPASRIETLNLVKFLLAAMPAFAAGLIEDVTKKASVMARLIATFASAVLAYWLFGAYLPRLDIWGLDTLLQITPLAVFITAVAVAGVTNSINIIDGFNGFAGSAVIIILAGLGFLSWRAGDTLVVELALLGIGATLGFLLVNYPTGRLFMGDGGAYLLGFWVAEVAVLLVARNPWISTWQVLAVCSYPVTEVLYSIYRKKVIRRISPGIPDRLHLHMLIYRRLVCRLIPRNNTSPWIRNAAVAFIAMPWIAAMTLLSVWVGTTVATALVAVAANVSVYMAVYTRLIRGRWTMNPAVVLGLRPQTAGRNSI